MLIPQLTQIASTVFLISEILITGDNIAVGTQFPRLFVCESYKAVTF